MPLLGIGEKVTVIKMDNGKKIILGYSCVTAYNYNAVKLVEFENEPVEPVKPIEEPVEPVKPVEEPVEGALKPIEPVEPVEPVEPIEEPVEGALERFEPVKSVEPVKPVEESVVGAKRKSPSSPSLRPVEPVVATEILKKVTKYIIDPDIDIQNMYAANLGLRPNDYYGPSFKGNGWKIEKYFDSKVRNRYTG
jgi:outer membrane biosynthesis protein TonB